MQAEILEQSYFGRLARKNRLREKCGHDAANFLGTKVETALILNSLTRDIGRRRPVAYLRSASKNFFF